jgi:hypothetical protein
MNGLSLQGGGCLGYGQTLILTEAESRWGAPAYSIFDIVGGTSVGSIVGAAVSTGMPAKLISQFFTQQAPLIFKCNIWNKISQAWGPKYNDKGLESGLQVLLGDKTMADCKTRFIATSYDFVSDRPIYFKSFEQSGETDDFIVVGPDSDIKLWQICRASSAAQTYFPAYLYNDMQLLDGGNCGDNNPDMLIFSEMVKLSSVDDMKVLSLGCGNSVWNKSKTNMTSPAPIKAGLETVTIVFSAGADSQSYKLQHILKDKYFRLSPDLGDGIAIDDAGGCLDRIPMAVNTLLNSSSEIISSFNKPITHQIYVRKN